MITHYSVTAHTVTVRGQVGRVIATGYRGQSPHKDVRETATILVEGGVMTLAAVSEAPQREATTMSVEAFRSRFPSLFEAAERALAGANSSGK